MPTFRMILEYDGTAYVGWQNQPNGRSVQGEIEAALRRILQEEISIVGGGRTDAGVHARGQVASFRAEKLPDPVHLRHSLNGVLPEDIVVRDLRRTTEMFHARRSALARRYRYSIERSRIAIARAYRWQLGYALNTTLMQHCAEAVRGEHDFQSFCKVDTETPNFLCAVSHAAWTEEGTTLMFDIRANRFLYGMVRALVGTMVDVGRGYTRLEQFHDILNARDRRAAGAAAPALGLVLEEITYPEEEVKP